MTSPFPAPGPDADSALMAALFAVDPAGLAGVALRARASSRRDDWLALLRSLMPEQSPWRRVPLNINDAALLGGLDLGATLQAGRPVAQQGVLAQADGGVVLLAMAERLPAGLAARLAAVLDTQEVATQRDGLALRQPARLGVVALDEGASDDEQPPAALLDRLAFQLRLDEPGPARADNEPVNWRRADIEQARALLPRVSVGDDMLQALCGAALALGVASMRGTLLAVRVARAAAALSGQEEVSEEHASLAARLVLAPRATRLPAPQQSEPDEPQQEQPDDSLPQEPPQEPPPPEAQQPPDQQADAPPPAGPPPDADDAAKGMDRQLAETVLDAAQAAIPPGLLAALKIGEASRSRSQAAGRAGAVQKGQARGRPIGARRGEPRAGARLNVIETLRAAAPWQRLRREASQRGGAQQQRIHVRREDFHVTRLRQLGQTTTLFVVDASGSSALHRLAEAKGAVELLLPTVMCGVTAWRCWRFAARRWSCCCRPPARWPAPNAAWRPCPAAAAHRWPPRWTPRVSWPARSHAGAKHPSSSC